MLRPSVLLLAAFLALAAVASVVAGDDDRGKGDARGDERNDDDERNEDERKGNDRGREGGKDREKDRGRGEDEERDRDGRGKESGQEKRRDGEDRGEGKGRGKDADQEDDQGRNDDGEGEPTPSDSRAGPHGQSGPPPSFPADVALRQSLRSEPGRLVYVAVAGNLGPGVASAATLDAQLPEVGGPWTVSGTGADGCAVADGRLACAWGDLAPGELRIVQAGAAVARAPAWVPEAVGGVAAANDEAPANDGGVSRVGILRL